LISFAGFHLNLTARQLRYRGTLHPLRGKSLAVLLYLARHPERLVTHGELLRAVWPGTTVSRTVLRVCIREIRAALGDEGAACLITVARHGYRFVVEPNADEDPERTFVGRDREIAHLQDALSRAGAGRRRVVFITGEAGAGKTAMLAHFLDEVRAGGHARIGLGQCLELHSGLEPYAPVLEPYAPVLDLLNRMCDEADGDDVIRVLTRWAPSWLQHLPGRRLRPAARRRRSPGPSNERMLRELSEAIERLARQQPLVFVLEDMHWSDASTIDAIAHLAQRTTTTQLLIVVSYRPGDSSRPESLIAAMQRRLQARDLCSEIPLERLEPQHVKDFLIRRLPAHPLGDDVVQAIGRYSGGLPLFMVTMVDHLLARRQLTLSDGMWHITGELDGVIPDAVGQLVASTVDMLDANARRVLDAASVVGASFSAAPVAAAIDTSIAAVEAVCIGLVKSGPLVEAGVDVWPDGTMSGRYDFTHAIYPDVLYHRLAVAERTRMHRAIAERIQAGYKKRPANVSAMLARHFTLAADAGRAVHFHNQAAVAAKERFAAGEAIVHLESALDLLQTLPATRERTGTELGCLLELADTTVALQGYSTPAVGTIYTRARQHAELLGLIPAQIIATGGQYAHHIVRAELWLARREAEHLRRLAEQVPAPFFAVLAGACLGSVLFSCGTLKAARSHLERADASWAAEFPHLPLDTAIICRGMLALTLLLLGEGVQAAAALQRSLERAGTLAEDPFSLAEAHVLAARFHATNGARAPALQHAEQALALAIEHGIATHRAAATVVKGWAVRDSGAILEGLSLQDEIGHRLARTLFDSLLAETLLDQGDAESALTVIDDALAFAANTGEAPQLAELYRLRGECVLRHGGANRLSAAKGRVAVEATKAFRTALSIANRQQARLWQQRAQSSLDA
jgi:DNA-binding winged helix-turn-helix (wHTH) protein/tetratricopeptide (TPR) repeat protein